jgi:preprotein translocase subunit SecD
MLGLQSTTGAAGAANSSTADPGSVSLRPVLLAPDALPPVADGGAGLAGDATAAIASCDPATVAALPAVAATAPSVVDPKACVVLADRDAPDEHYYLGPTELSATGIKSAKAKFFGGEGWAVEVKLTKRGATAFDELVGRHYQEQVAIVVDDRVASAPTIMTPDWHSDTILITGAGQGVTHAGARALAARVRAAAAAR